MTRHRETRGLTVVRAGTTAVLLGLLAPPLMITCLAAGLPQVPSVAATLIVIGFGLVMLWRVLPARWPQHGQRIRLLFALWFLLSAVAVYRLATMSVFMLDPGAQAYAFNPATRVVSDSEINEPFYLRHNCFTSYVLGGYLAGEQVENVYDPAHYRGTETPTPIHEQIGDTHTIDRYQYPPPFLILPRLLFAATNDFFQMRTYWFALNVLVTVLAIGVMVVWIGGRNFNAYWLALPLVLAAPNMLGTLQIGNAHFFIVCLAALAMVAFEKRREWLGAGLLGFAILSKIFPGVLLVYLLFRRRWNAVIRTVLVMFALCLVTLLVYGDRPYRAFMDFQLPRLVSGEAFSFARENARAILVNLSAMGAVYKLHTLDLLAADPDRLADLVMRIFTLLLLAAILLAGWKHTRHPFLRNGGPTDARERRAFARTWLALLVLGQLRNPFLPWTYGSLAVLWLIGLFVPPGGRWLLPGSFVAVGWLVFAIGLPWPIGPESTDFDMALTLAASFVAAILSLTVVASTLWRPARRAKTVAGRDAD